MDIGVPLDSIVIAIRLIFTGLQDSSSEFLPDDYENSIRLIEFLPKNPVRPKTKLQLI